MSEKSSFELFRPHQEETCDCEMQYDPHSELFVCPNCGHEKPHNGTPPEYEKYIETTASTTPSPQP
jgi:hypothetical protein